MTAEQYLAPDGRVYEKEDGEWIWKNDNVSESIQKNIDLLRTHSKRIAVKVRLFDDNYIELDSLTGRICEAPSYNIDSESEIRRTCNITLYVPLKDKLNIDFENTWNKRMVELSCGIYSVRNNEYVWYKLGRMLMTNGSTIYDKDRQEINLNLVDLSATLSRERGSQMGSSLKAEAGSNVKDVLTYIIAQYGVYKHTEICEFEDTIPYDISSNIGDYPIDFINDIIKLFPYYEYFYNDEGTFIVRKIPMKVDDPIDFNKEILDDIIISETRDIDFSKIYNTTEICGRDLTSDYTAFDCTTVDSCYHVIIDESFTELVSGETYTIMPVTDSVIGQTMKIQDTAEYQIYTSDGAGTTYTPITAGAMKSGVPYVIRYFEEKFILEGELTVRAIVQEITEEPSDDIKESYKTENNCDNVEWLVNPDSPFACTIQNGFIRGEKKQVFEGGEYSAIYSTSLAIERASYETWKSCRQQDTIEIEMILVPWMDVNDKIEFTSPSTGEPGVWLVKNISYNFNNWTMTVSACRFYPYYPWL